ncbi:Rap1a/Tai family immunity protein [Pseudomonas laurylsulfatiphila]|uniref:Rap1a/Tai family immunity protein n=1 Tax=Pseudomonas laurylsulfatiphila TaxID=2011015 RepID=UPI003D1FED86
MKAWIGAVGLAGMLGSGAAMAEGGDGNELIKQCADGVKAANGATLNSYSDATFCLGLTQGVRHTMRLVNEKLPPQYQTCFPSGITNGQGMRIVLKYLQDHPDRLHEQDSDLVYLAYKTAYPCK